MANNRNPFNKDFYENLLAKELAGEINAQELEELRNYEIAFPEALAIRYDFETIYAIADSSSSAKELPFNADIAWQQVQARIGKQTTNKAKQGKRLLWLTYAAAASLLLGIIGWNFWAKSGSEVVFIVKSAGNEGLNLTLPDGSTVSLKPNTRIAYDSVHFLESRILQLEQGTAYFEVTKRNGASFMVETPDAKVKVLGTHFEVALQQNGTQVSVTEGRVSVRGKSNATDSLILTKNMIAIASDKQLVRIFNAEQTISELSFENTNLAKVCLRLSDAFAIPITIGDSSLLTYKVTASYHERTLTQILENLEELYGLKAEKTNNTILLIRK